LGPLKPWTVGTLIPPIGIKTAGCPAALPSDALHAYLPVLASNLAGKFEFAGFWIRSGEFYLDFLIFA
jgi:hypothetical protein